MSSFPATLRTAAVPLIAAGIPMIPAVALAHDLAPLLHRYLLPLLIALALVTLWVKHLLLSRKAARTDELLTVRLIALTLADVILWTGLVPLALRIGVPAERLTGGAWVPPLLVAGLTSVLLHWAVLKNSLTLRPRGLWLSMVQLAMVYPLLVSAAAGLLIRWRW